MAIVNSVLLGTTRGSVGNVTLRRSGGETIASQKVSRVSNPRSYAQAEQRMRMAAAGAAYSSLSAVLAKSWQGKTRVQSQSEFTRAAIRTMADGLYGHIKGYGMVPYPFQVSKGTLPSLPLDAVAVGDATTSTRLLSLNFGPYATSAANTLGQWYTDFANYLGVSYSRIQLTFIVVFALPDDGNVIRFAPRWFRLILAPNDSTVVTFPSWLPPKGTWESGDLYSLPVTEESADEVAAATCIASGWDGRKWVRSTQRLMVTPAFAQLWQRNYDASVATYMDAAAVADPEGDVYLDGQGTRRAPAAEFDYSIYRPAVTNAPTEALPEAAVITGTGIANLGGGVMVAGVVIEQEGQTQTYALAGSQQTSHYLKAMPITAGAAPVVIPQGTLGILPLTPSDAASQRAFYAHVSSELGIDVDRWFNS